jgi:hypothetical protein
MYNNDDVLISLTNMTLHADSADSLAVQRMFTRRRLAS